MRFDLDGLDVFFPYDRIYLEQHQYMRSLKQSLDNGGHCLLEMPTGTGKTVCLLSLITSYQYAYPNKIGKLIYCTRTVPEMNHVMEELGVVLSYRNEQIQIINQNEIIQQQQQQQEIQLKQEQDNNPINQSNDIENVPSIDTVAIADTSSMSPPAKRPRKIDGTDPNKHRGAAKQRKQQPNQPTKRRGMGPSSSHNNGGGGGNVLALCLSSRRNMCIHERVMTESDREAVDSACRNMTSSWILEQNKKHPGSIETCPYYDTFLDAGESTSMPNGIYDLMEIQKYASYRGWCPYYLTRSAINHAQILVFNYQYMLDPKVAKIVSKELESECIIVFDEAHNIDSVCIEALSVTINDRQLDQATRSLGRLSNEVSKLKATDNQRLQNEYSNLINGLIDQGLLNTSTNDAALASVSYIY